MNIMQKIYHKIHLNGALAFIFFCNVYFVVVTSDQYSFHA